MISLKADGFKCLHVSLAQDAIDAVKNGAVSLVVLDVGLPDFSGFEACKEIRKFSSVPIIFLTARSEEIDRVVGLEIGADDYVTKPFSPRELLARIKLRLRDFTATPSMSGSSNLKGVFFVDNDRKIISYKNVALDLTLFEFGILVAMLGQLSCFGRPA